MSPRSVIALYSLLASFVACGGKSNVEPNESSAGSGGSATAGGGGTSPANSECPAQPPKVGTSCSYVGRGCNYPIDQCSSAAFVCMGGAWQPAPQLDGARPTCTSYGPGAVPSDGSSCLCQGMLDCSIDDCTGAGLIHATCDNTRWLVTSQPCTATKPCGPKGLRCKVGEVCVVGPGPEGSYSCQLDPCAELLETTNCDCAASLCSAPSERCQMIAGAVECICDTC